MDSHTVSLECHLSKCLKWHSKQNPKTLTVSKPMGFEHATNMESWAIYQSIFINIKTTSCRFYSPLPNPTPSTPYLSAEYLSHAAIHVLERCYLCDKGNLYRFHSTTRLLRWVPSKTRPRNNETRTAHTQIDPYSRFKITLSSRKRNYICGILNIHHSSKKTAN